MHTKPRIEGYYPYSTEKDVVLNLLPKFLRSSYESVLDVGCGSGTLTELLHERTKQLHLCEISPFYEEDLKRKFPTSKIDILPIESVTLGKYDLIFFSQALYYHSSETWHSLIDRLMESLTPGGHLILITNSDAGDWWTTVRTVWERYPNELKFSYIPGQRLISELEERYDLSTHQFTYDLTFPHAEALGQYVRKSCLPLKNPGNEIVAGIIEDHILELVQKGLKLSYKSDLIDISF